MVVIFVLCSFPLDLYNIYQVSSSSFIIPSRRPSIQDIRLLDSSYYSESSTTQDLLFLVPFLVALTGTLWNPLVYAWWNENFQRELRRSLQCSHRRLSVLRRTVWEKGGKEKDGLESFQLRVNRALRRASSEPAVTVGKSGKRDGQPAALALLPATPPVPLH